jgi:hypothetical protein
MQSRDELYRRVAESAQRDVARWPSWKKSPPTVPVQPRSDSIPPKASPEKK